MVAPPAAQEQQQQQLPVEAISASGDRSQSEQIKADTSADTASGDRCPLSPEIDPSTPAASTPGEQKDDDTMGDKGGKRTAEEADCFPEIGEGEEEAVQSSAKKPAATRRSVRISEVPDEDVLVNAQGDLAQRGNQLDATVEQAVQATLAVQAIIGKSGKRGNDSSSSSSSVASLKGEPRG